MAEPEEPRKLVKVGVREGGGPAPGYQWNVAILDEAFEESRSFLDDDQYEHMARQVRELARQDDPTHSQTVDVRPVDVFFEIRDKGGILGKLNTRIYFFLTKVPKSIVILGASKKEREGQMLPALRITILRRRRRYLEAYHPEV